METLCIIASAIVLGSVGVFAGISGWVIATTMLGAGVGVASIVLFVGAINILLEIADREFDNEDEDGEDEDSLVSDVGKYLDEVNQIRKAKGL